MIAFTGAQYNGRSGDYVVPFESVSLDTKSPDRKINTVQSLERP